MAERLASLIFTNELLEPVMSDQFGNVPRPAIECGVCWLASMRNALAALSADASVGNASTVLRRK
jgi:hypothetical protein